MARTSFESPRYRLVVPGFSQAVASSVPGRLLFVSGLTARDANGQLHGVGDAGAQTRRILGALADIVAEAGGALDDVVRTVTYLIRMDDYEAVHRERQRAFGRIHPASTTVQVTRLYDERQLVEIEATAIVPDVADDQ